MFGKSAIQNELLKLGYNVSINYTTREKRTNEKDDIDYHFVTKEKFEELWNNGFIIEKSIFNNNYYGIGKESAKEDIVCILDLNGLNQIKQTGIKIVSFYIDLDEEEKINRMIKRGDNKEEIFIKNKLDNIRFKGAEKLVDYVVKNIDLNETVKFIVEKSAIANNKL